MRKHNKFLFISIFTLIFLSSSVYADNSSASYTLVSCVLNSSGSCGQTPSFKADDSIGETVINLFTGQNYYVKAGFICTIIKKTDILSILVEPESWNIGSVNVNNVVTMTGANKILITNDGTGEETLDLRLINPVHWTASDSAGNERYVLSGVFCGTGDTPGAGAFEADDMITAATKKANDYIFGYNASTANGVSVPSAAIRALYLQFKSPALTQRMDEQQVSVIVSCQAP